MTNGAAGDMEERRAASSDRAEGIPLLEEEVRIGKREVATGRVRVQTTTDMVEEIARATLNEDVVEVTRVPVGREVDTAPQVRTENDVVIVPVLEEVLIVEKRLVLKEELHIRRSVTRENIEVPIALRKQRAVVERLGPESPPDADKP
jgi:uncharacterized protein (TIGR02271 family)